LFFNSIKPKAIFKFYIHIAFFLLGTSIQLVAQLKVAGYPVELTQFNQQLSFQNPAAICKNNEWETSLTSKRNIGFWRNNQTYFASGAFRINPRKKSSFQTIGAQFYYDKEGIYLHRYRAYLLYSYHVALNKDWTLSTGLSVGMMTYQVGNNDYEGGTANTSDASIGMMLYNKLFFGGISIGQLPENKVQPILETTVLNRYIQTTIGKDFGVGEDIIIKSGINARFFTQTKTPDISLQSGIVWNELVGLYGSYRWNKQAAIIFGLEKIEIDGMQFRTYFSYNLTVNGDNRYRGFELTLQYLMPEKQKVKSKTRKRK
jgi:hypothetical protein